MDENDNNSDRFDNDEIPVKDPQWLTLALLLGDRRLFETLFTVFRERADSKEAKNAAWEQLQNAARARGLSFVEFMELLTDFSYWISELGELPDIQGE